MPLCHILTRTVFISLACSLGSLHLAAAESASPGTLLKGQDALGDWTKDAPGVRRLITTNDLPKPFATQSAALFSQVVPRPDGAWPKAPAGFNVDLLIDGLDNPRNIMTAPNGDLFIAESKPGRIKLLREGEGGRVARVEVFAEHLDQPFGIAFYPPGPNPKYVYVGNTGAVIRFPYTNGDLHATGPAETIVDDIPAGGGHWTRNVVFSPDGKKMFVAVGSQSNVNDDAAERHRADVHEYNPDGTGFRIFAAGIRNPVGLAIEPKTGQLWGSVNERDGLGDNLPCDYITHFAERGFYGWPWYYLGDHQDPRHEGAHPEWIGKVTVPDVLIQAHSASLCLAFYTADQFPPEYRGGAFAAEHGSWNRAQLTGYKIIYVPLKDGKATGEYEDFVTGFVAGPGKVWGRPVGVTVDKQGSLLFTDDGAGRLWRVRYTGKTAAEGAPVNP